jgi:hypothetical protein
MRPHHKLYGAFGASLSAHEMRKLLGKHASLSRGTFLRIVRRHPACIPFTIWSLRLHFSYMRRQKSAHTGLLRPPSVSPLSLSGNFMGRREARGNT